MRISDWSSDVCSSDLLLRGAVQGNAAALRHRRARADADGEDPRLPDLPLHRADHPGRPLFPVLQPGRRRRSAPDRILAEVPLERSEEHTSELQSLMRISYAVFCLTKKTHYN